MWLPRPLYETLPYFSVVAGVACLVAAWFADDVPRSVLFLLGGGLATLGVLLWMRRRDYRSTQSSYDPRALDE